MAPFLQHVQLAQRVFLEGKHLCLKHTLFTQRSFKHAQGKVLLSPNIPLKSTEIHLLKSTSLWKCAWRTEPVSPCIFLQLLLNKASRVDVSVPTGKKGRHHCIISCPRCQIRSQMFNLYWLVSVYWSTEPMRISFLWLSALPTSGLGGGGDTATRLKHY